MGIKVDNGNGPIDFMQTLQDGQYLYLHSRLTARITETAVQHSQSYDLRRGLPFEDGILHPGLWRNPIPPCALARQPSATEVKNTLRGLDRWQQRGRSE